MCKKLLSGAILHYKKLSYIKWNMTPQFMQAGREDLALSVERHNFINALPGSSTIMINHIGMFCIWV